MKQRYFWIVLVLMMTGLAAYLVSCHRADNEIAVLKYATHPALDELEIAYTDELSRLLSSDPSLKDYKIERYNANGSPQTAKSLAQSFVPPTAHVRLILTIGTPAAIAVSNTTSTIPFVYGAVADPQGAGIVPSSR